MAYAKYKLEPSNAIFNTPLQPKLVDKERLDTKEKENKPGLRLKVRNDVTMQVKNMVMTSQILIC